MTEIQLRTWLFLAVFLPTIWPDASTCSVAAEPVDTLVYYYAIPDTNTYAIFLDSGVHRAGLSAQDTALLVHWFMPETDTVCLSENILRIIYPDVYSLDFNKGEGMSAPRKGYNYFRMVIKTDGEPPWLTGWEWTGTMRDDKSLLCGTAPEYLEVSYQVFPGGFTEPMMRIIIKKRGDGSSILHKPQIGPARGSMVKKVFTARGLAAGVYSSPGCRTATFTLDGRGMRNSPSGSVWYWRGGH
jgi:hypothetical protein